MSDPSLIMRVQDVSCIQDRSTMQDVPDDGNVPDEDAESDYQSCTCRSLILDESEPRRAEDGGLLWPLRWIWECEPVEARYLIGFGSFNMISYMMLSEVQDIIGTSNTGWISESQRVEASTGRLVIVLAEMTLGALAETIGGVARTWLH